jgi:hypothetical protein
MAGAMFVEVLKSRLRFLRKRRGALAPAIGRVLIATSVFMRWIAREAQGVVSTLRGRHDETLALRVRQFRAAAAWVLRGLPAD